MDRLHATQDSRKLQSEKLHNLRHLQSTVSMTQRRRMKGDLGVNGRTVLKGNLKKLVTIVLTEHQ